MDNILQGYLQDPGRQDPTTNEVYKAAHAATQGRTTSTFEAVHYILGYSPVFFSREHLASSGATRHVDAVCAAG